MSSGFYLMYRGWRSNAVFKNEPYTEREAWEWLIEEASYADREWRISGRIVTLERGQLCHSLRYIGQAWGWQKDRVARYLKRLESVSMICVKTATANATAESVISIVNYARYQVSPDTNATADETGTRQQRDKTKEIKEGNSPKGAQAPSSEKQVFDLGKQILGPKAGGVITQLRKALNYDDPKALTILADAEGKSSPMQWVQGVIREQTARVAMPGDNHAFAERSSQLLAAGYSAADLAEMNVRGMSDGDFAAKLNAKRRAA